jgi:hypothetical protein
MSSGLDRETAAIRRTIARCAEILKSFPPVDTFLGRKTQEPFPKEKEETRVARSLPPK